LEQQPCFIELNLLTRVFFGPVDFDAATDAAQYLASVMTCRRFFLGGSPDFFSGSFWMTTMRVILAAYEELRRERRCVPPRRSTWHATACPTFLSVDCFSVAPSRPVGLTLPVAPIMRVPRPVQMRPGAEIEGFYPSSARSGRFLTATLASSDCAVDIKKIRAKSAPVAVQGPRGALAHQFLQVGDGGFSSLQHDKLSRRDRADSRPMCRF
jgi:hypothetical protein